MERIVKMTLALLIIIILTAAIVYAVLPYLNYFFGAFILYIIFRYVYHFFVKRVRLTKQLAAVLVILISIFVVLQYFTNWIEKSSSFIPISKYFSVKCLKS
jgi:predicted PurR-regulated permease PerM